MACAMAGEMRATAAAKAAHARPGEVIHARILLALAALMETLAALLRDWLAGRLPAPSPRPGPAPRPHTPFPTDRAVTWSRSRPESARAPRTAHPDSAVSAPTAGNRELPLHSGRGPRSESTVCASGPLQPPVSPTPRVQAHAMARPAHALFQRRTAAQTPLFFKNAKRAGCRPTPFSFRNKFVP
jgi:hypothetical protein